MYTSSAPFHANMRSLFNPFRNKQTMVEEVRSAVEVAMVDKSRALEEDMDKIRKESRQAAESARQASAGSASRSDLEVNGVRRG